ncbi:MAG: 4-(cytidine 5'-diphospho)-2-C-methyl-D-erythritol kinase [Bacteroidales bacterium]|jgi:4-diphosphocytidyl-2-C-methyl-D-erythritol kinase|nr:4-(cytidine 5'-diphospho)-2-C-methyl-D-erythritol kinase [Bacteroidales bacterium]
MLSLPAMIVYPNAKINIGLWVTGKRPDGFHNIETVFYPVSLSDTLEITLSGSKEKCVVECRGMELEKERPENNLCYRACRLLESVYELPPVSIRLHKRIPVGAGLGGGSSDGAYTLQALNRLCRLRISDAELTEYARRLGSDCAFFMQRKPAWGTGKGDILQPVELSLAGYRLLLVKPPVFVSTAEAYSSVTPKLPPAHLPDLLKLPVTEWSRHIDNAFEPSVFSGHPEIGRIKDKMYEAGAVYASMSGSGSSVYGIFKQIPAKADKIFDGCFVWHDGQQSPGTV